MVSDYESVRWLIEFFYDLMEHSEGCLLWPSLLLRIALYGYSVICITLVPIVMLHRGIADLRKGIFSIYEIIASGVHSYPGLLPWSRGCDEKDPEPLKLAYYVTIHAIWFFALGIGSLSGFHGMYDNINLGGDPYDPGLFILVVANVVIWNASWIYSIALMIWRVRFDRKHHPPSHRDRQPKISIYPSVIVCLLTAPQILMIADFTESFYDRWWEYTSADLLHPFNPTDYGLDYGYLMINLIVVVWMIVSCVWMVAKEILVRKVSI